MRVRPVYLLTLAGGLAATVALVPGTFTPKQPIRAKFAEVGEADVPVYAIYERPRDFPGGYVVRKYVAKPGVVKIGELVGTADTLDDARRLVPANLSRFDRHPVDDKAIVETWL